MSTCLLPLQKEVTEFFSQGVMSGEVIIHRKFLRYSLISNAEVIAGPTGAVWTNMIFCREGAKCLCWMADGYGDFSAFSNLARAVGADMRNVTFKTDAKSVKELYNRKYFLEAKKIQKELDILLSAAT